MEEGEEGDKGEEEEEEEGGEIFAKLCTASGSLLFERNPDKSGSIAGLKEHVS